MKDVIVRLLKKELKLDEEKLNSLIEIPPDEKLGDYAFPCFFLSKEQNRNPVEIAKELVKKINVEKEEEVEKVEAQGAYVNFFVNKKILAGETMKTILKEKENFGKTKKLKKEKILIEHTSVNPNAAPHVGRTRNSIIGDSVVRILKFQGNHVKIHYYVNDVSKQVAMLALVCSGKEKFSQLLEKYVQVSKKIKENPLLEAKVFGLLRKFEKKDKTTVQKFKKIVDIAVKGQKEIFEKIGIKFDSFDYESKYMDTKPLLKEFEKTGRLFKDEQGRHVLDQSNTLLVRKMRAPMLVLTRSDGTGLYILRDLAYTTNKMKKADKNIIILGEDQKLYFEQLKEALKLLNKQAPKVVHYSFVLIQDIDKNIKKMSTRSGELVLLEKFLEEAEKKAKQEISKRKTKGDAKKIAIGAVKYTMLKNDNNKNIIFNWEQALNFEGDSGPYLQYSYARASSIIKKSKNKPSIKFKINNLNENEIRLAKKLSIFPYIIENSYKQLNPSLIANYSFQLAQLFNEFYHSCPVINDENEAFRLALVESFRIVIKNSLYLLGIGVMEEM